MKTAIFLLTCCITQPLLQVSESAFTEECNVASALTLNTAVYSTTTGVVIDEGKTQFTTCGETNKLFDINNAGVFYSIVGTDALMRASTCFTETDFDNRISVFQNCTTHKSCLASESGGNTNECSITGSSMIEWQSMKGETYYIKVQNEKAGQSGNFGLLVEEVQPSNDSCLTASQLDEGNTLEGTTSGSNSENSVECNGESSSFPGVWYHIPAQAEEEEEDYEKRIVVVVCASQKFDMSVYSGTCDDLRCYESDVENDLECEDGSLASMTYFNESKKESFYIYVNAQEGAQFRIGHQRFSQNDDGESRESGTINLGSRELVTFAWVLALFLWL